MEISFLIQKIKKRIYRLSNNMSYGHLGIKSKIIKPIRIIGRKHFIIGNKTTILNGARIEAIDLFDNKSYIINKPTIDIGNEVSIGQNFHCVCVNKIIIKNKVTIAPNVLINDSEHVQEIGKSIRETGLKIGSVIINECSFIGNGVTILAGNKDIVIGKNAVIGANSVVLDSIPDYAIAVGSPARIVKYLNDEDR